ncbi:MAG: methyltransferase [Candidatus Pacebacteria bacterium]|nr:methyltransferase [Candidatus Paceibacterota bacterium]
MYLTDDAAKQKVLQEKYGGIENEAYRADCARIDAHEPWEYILGYADFLGCKIDLSSKPMVPRDETAHWVARVIEEWRDKGSVTALDLYAGSGNIGIALLKHLPEMSVTFNELDANLLPQIAKSLEINDIDPLRATLIAGDSLEKVREKFDVICANPPYVDPRGEADMDPEMRYEPHIAFFGSSDGYGHHKELIARGREFLTPHGVLYGEFDMTQADEIKRLLAASDWDYEIRNDPYGHPGLMVLRA